MSRRSLRSSVFGIALLDAPVLGGPAKAAAGTMTMMVSGDAERFARVRTLLDRIAGRVFMLGSRPATHRRSRSSTTCSPPRTSPRRRGAGDRAARRPRPAARLRRRQRELGRELDLRGPRRRAPSPDDYAPRAATRLLDKDVGHRRDARGAARRRRAVHPSRGERVCRGDGRGCAEDDDAVLVRLALDAASRRSDR
jgi:hypothetical protein